MAAKSGEKTSFALACGLLSKFMKDKSNINLDLGMNDSYKRPRRTMNLLPGFEAGSKEDQEDNASSIGSALSLHEIKFFPLSPSFEACKGTEKNTVDKEKNGKLMIIYGGKTLVFDNFPEEKARDLIEFASENENTSSPQIQEEKPIFADLPIMRKASLQRFLEKRKDRLNAKAPYHKPKIVGDSIKKENKFELDSWLSLNL